MNPSKGRAKAVTKLQAGVWDYVLTLVLCALALPLTLAFADAHNPPIFLLFFVALAFSSWRGGWGCALLAVVIVLGEEAYLRFPPVGPLLLSLHFVTHAQAVVAVVVGTGSRFFLAAHGAGSQS